MERKASIVSTAVVSTSGRLLAWYSGKKVAEAL
jgi:hypothetical protein